MPLGTTIQYDACLIPHGRHPRSHPCWLCIPGTARAALYRPGSSRLALDRAGAGGRAGCGSATTSGDKPPWVHLPRCRLVVVVPSTPCVRAPVPHVEVALRRALPSRAAIDLPPPPMARSGTRQLSPLCMADAAFDRPMVLRADRPCYVAQRPHAALRCRAQTEPTQHATPAFRQIAIAPPPHSSAPASPPGRRDGALAGWARVWGCWAARPSHCCMREAALVVPRCRRPHVPPSRCTPVAPNAVM